MLMKQLANSQHADSIMTEVLVQEILWILGQVKKKKKKQLNLYVIFEIIAVRWHDFICTIFVQE